MNKMGLLSWIEQLPAGLNWCDVKTIDQQGAAQANTSKMIDEVSSECCEF